MLSSSTAVDGGSGRPDPAKCKPARGPTVTCKDFQQLLDQIEAAMSLWDRFKRWRRTRDEPASESIAGRFCRLFETHGVHRNQIPRFFDRGLTLEDVQNDVSLLAKLDEQLLESACERFAIRREWLDGADVQAHPTHRFYKRPSDFASFVSSLQAANPDGELRGVVIAPFDGGDNAPALLILEEQIGWVGERSICRYHLCDDWVFSYWKARAYLAACVAIGWKKGAYIRGRKAPRKEIDLLASGKTLMGWDGEGFGAIGSRRWDPEYLALRPDSFLSGLDPELENFGLRSGLQLWLDLQRDGFMDTGLPMYEEGVLRTLFERELAKAKEMTD